MQRKNFIIFSDLDGTLLDHETFSFERAREALIALERADIPLVFCTSKTRRETEYWRERTGNRHPFIVENGGAIYIPSNYFLFEIPAASFREGYYLIELGERYDRLRQFLLSFRENIDPTIRGFGDMSLEEIIALSGLSPEMAALARQREYDEPFTGGNQESLRQLRKEAEKFGLKILGGSRFYHLTGKSDKGTALQRVKRLFAQHLGEVQTVAFGDSQNDEAMLASADQAYLVQRSDGSYDNRVKLGHLIYAQGIGPAGWNQTILDLLRSREI
ncbi:MAG: HAD-IIB family hydrolase [Candidatus Aminicenantales bacterium]